MARKLAVHLYWMWRQGWDYGQFGKVGSHAGAPGNPMVRSKSPAYDWVSATLHGEFEVVIMIAVGIEEMDGSD
ncbi:MAG: hypothetical protein ACYDDS_10705 [Candidatus Sulfotelmatobacter sp.]|jgi:hypothetical protein